MPQYCSGCGVKLQQQDVDAPGYFQLPKRFLEQLQQAAAGAQQAPPNTAEVADDSLSDSTGQAELAEAAATPQPDSGRRQDSNENSAVDEPAALRDNSLEAAAARLAERIVQSNATATASGGSVGGSSSSAGGSGDRRKQQADEWEVFNDLAADWGEEAGGSGKRGSRKLQGGPPEQLPEAAAAAAAESAAGVPVLCARCHSLTHHGAVKSKAAEAQMPAFDLGRRVGRKIAATPHRRAVVLCVVDAADFDGSLPRAALSAIVPRGTWEAAQSAGPAGQPQYLDGGFRLVLVANKADLLPSQISRPRLEQWVRTRAKQGGFPRLSAVHLVSSVKGTGVSALLQTLRAAAGAKGDVWVVGAQNAGKSSLINAMRQAVGLSRGRNITTAALPGTTLGMLKVEGLMPARCGMFDTPGMPHSHQLAAKLDPEEVRMLLPRKTLKPRTFRIAPGQTVLLGGVARFDVLSAPAATIYLTLWASADIVTHFGKTEAATEKQAQHAGSRLTPPLGDAKRMKRLPQLVPTNVAVSCTSFRASGTDVAVAGLGWVGVAAAGDVQLRVWALDGVAITTRDAMVPDLAAELERPGFSNVGGGGTAPPKQRGGGGRKK